jgi:myo-inositol-1(or 4)-monophosphatase
VSDPVREVVLAAGRQALARLRAPGLGRRDKARGSRAPDWVTDVDLAAHARIRDVLAARFPDIPLISEEDEAAAHEAPRGDAFVLDPLDGTHNFGAGTGWWTVALARVRGRTVEECWLYQPAGDLFFHAARNVAATCNQQPIRVADRPTREGLLSVSLSREMLPLLLASDRWAGLRAIGSTALALGMVADGQFDAHGGGGWAWDLAAGTLLIERAGGRVCDLLGQPHDLWGGGPGLFGAPRAVDACLDVFARSVDPDAHRS